MKAKRVSVIFWKKMPEMCPGAPMPPVPAEALSGLALSQATSAARSLAGRVLRATSSKGPLVSSEIVAKSCSRSYGKV